MPTDDEMREQVRTAVQTVLWNASNYPAKVQARMLGQDVSPLTAKVTDAILPLIAEAVAAERERIESILIDLGIQANNRSIDAGSTAWAVAQVKVQAYQDAVAAIRADREPEPATEEEQ